MGLSRKNKSNNIKYIYKKLITKEEKAFIKQQHMFNEQKQKNARMYEWMNELLKEYIDLLIICLIDWLIDCLEWMCITLSMSP